MKYKLYKPLAIHEYGKRANQEDSIYPAMGQATADNRVFIVCDGMGGHEKGEVASAAVCRGISASVEHRLTGNSPFTKDDFMQALSEAYSELNAADAEKEGKMGTTMTFVCLHRGGVLAAYIGDSRIYHLRPQTREVLYRSRDHSLVQQLYELGEISYNEMKTSPRKNIILRAMQPYQAQQAQPAFVDITDVQPGDYFYMCSDGMLENMEDDELMDILSASMTDAEKAAELVRRTAGNSDNHSAYLIHIEQVETEDGDDRLIGDEAEQRKMNKCLHDTNKDVAWTINHTATVDAIDLNDDDNFPQAAAPVSQQAPVATAKGKTPGDGKKTWILLVAVLAVAAAVVAFLLFGGKDSSPAKDFDDADEPQKEDVRQRNVEDEERESKEREQQENALDDARGGQPQAAQPVQQGRQPAGRGNALNQEQPAKEEQTNDPSGQTDDQSIVDYVITGGSAGGHSAEHVGTAGSSGQEIQPEAGMSTTDGTR